MAALFGDLPKAASESDKAQAQKRLILDTAYERFRRYGLRRVTMDELARQMRISKKTLYAHFPSKEAIVQACVDRIAEGIFKKVQMALGQNHPSSMFERLAFFQDAMLEVGRMLSTELLSDLESEFPHIWEAIDERRRMAAGLIESFYEEGVARGEINPHINPKVARAMHLAFMQCLLHPDALAKGDFTPAEVMETILTIFRHGILTPKGKRAE